MSLISYNIVEIYLIYSYNFTFQFKLMSFITSFLIIFTVFGLSFFLINIRQIFTGQEFRGTCASNNPMVKDKFGNCTVCGKGPEEICENPETKTPNGMFPKIGN